MAVLTLLFNKAIYYLYHHCRLVRNILGSFKPDFRVQKLTLECLQEAAEMYLVQLFEDSYMCCLHRQRVTLSEKDIRIAQVIRGPQDPGRVV